MLESSLLKRLDILTRVRRAETDLTLIAAKLPHAEVDQDLKDCASLLKDVGATLPPRIDTYQTVSHHCDIDESKSLVGLTAKIPMGYAEIVVTT